MRIFPVTALGHVCLTDATTAFSVPRFIQQKSGHLDRRTLATAMYHALVPSNFATSRLSDAKCRTWTGISTHQHCFHTHPRYQERRVIAIAIHGNQQEMVQQPLPVSCRELHTRPIVRQQQSQGCSRIKHRHAAPFPAPSPERNQVTPPNASKCTPTHSAGQLPTACSQTI